MHATESRFSRRHLLAATATATGAAALAACAADPYDGQGVYAMRVHRVPDDPDDDLWTTAAETTVALGPQDIALPLRLDPSVTAVRVRALHDGQRVGFRLEWDDQDADDLTVRVDDYRDACAVLLVEGAPNDLVRPMGTATQPATLLHWKADWQRDLDNGRQGLDDAYPNRSVDVYPIVHDVPAAEVGVDTYEAADATEWLPGVHVGNPISGGGRTTPVEKAIAYGFSTTTTAATQDARGRGVRTDTGWRVVASKPLRGTDDGEAGVRPGGQLACAFAVWSGSAHDAGGRKCPATVVNRLDLAP